MSLRIHTSGNDRHWQFAPRHRDPSLRYMTHGPIQPMERPSWLARLFGAR